MAIWNADLFETLSVFVAIEHGEQTFKQAPYYLHLTQVCSRAMRAALENPALDIDKIMSCALLHDVIEDCANTQEDHDRIAHFITKQCGDDILQGVLALSKKEILGPHGSKDKRAMMQDSLQRIRQQSSEVWVVKLADRICNLQEPPSYWDSTKRKNYVEEAKLIHQKLHTASPLLAQELQNRIDSYRQYIQ